MRDDGLCTMIFVNVRTWLEVAAKVFVLAIELNEDLKTVKYFAGSTGVASTGLTESVRTLLTVHKEVVKPRAVFKAV